MLSSVRMKALLLLVLALHVPSTESWYQSDQKVFPDPLEHGHHYKFSGPIKNVAIIGAGVGGLVAYREFTREGFNVRLFERDSVPGGNWHYSEQIPVPAHYSAVPTEIADYIPNLPPAGAELPYEEIYDNGPKKGLTYEERLQQHRGPKPLWESLHSNAPAPIQQVTEIPWPVGTPWELPHRTLGRYLRAFASWHGVNSNDENFAVSYNTRVEDVRKITVPNAPKEVWRLTLRKLSPAGKGRCKLTWWTEDFDAVVVATGRYNAASIPRIRGVEAWAQKWPHSLQHSREYRHPDLLRNKTVLIIGGAVSYWLEFFSSERHFLTRLFNSNRLVEVRYLGRVVDSLRKIYQSIRPDNDTALHFRLDYLLRRIPANVSIVPEIEEFRSPKSADDINSGEVKLVNGTILTGIDHIIFATGFKYTFPFFPQYHDSKLQANETANGKQPLITDGTHVRSLHLDILYIEEPTLGFINLNVGMQSFTYGEFAALALARVWAGRAHIPDTEELWRLYWKRVEDRGGHTKRLQFLGGERTEESIRFFVGWLNKASTLYGGRQLDLLPKEKAEISRYWSEARYGGSPEGRLTNGTDDKPLSSWWISPLEGSSYHKEDLVYDDWW